MDQDNSEYEPGTSASSTVTATEGSEHDALFVMYIRHNHSMTTEACCALCVLSTRDIALYRVRCVLPCLTATVSQEPNVLWRAVYFLFLLNKESHYGDIMRDFPFAACSIGCRWMNLNMKRKWNENDWGKAKYSEWSPLSSTLSTRSSTWNAPLFSVQQNQALRTFWSLYR